MGTLFSPGDLMAPYEVGPIVSDFTHLGKAFLDLLNFGEDIADVDRFLRPDSGSQPENTNPARGSDGLARSGLEDLEYWEDGRSDHVASRYSLSLR